MLRDLDAACDREWICSYGLNLTTLEEVFQRVTCGETSSLVTNMPIDTPGGEDDTNFLVRDSPKPDLAFQHLRALLQKRLITFKRDKKAWCFTTLLPVVFVLVGFLALKYASPSKNLELLSLELDAYNLGFEGASEARNPIPYNAPGSYFKCQPGWCSYQAPIIQNHDTEELYFFCGAQSYLLSQPNCSIDMSREITDRISEAGAAALKLSIHDISQVS